MSVELFIVSFDRLLGAVAHVNQALLEGRYRESTAALDDGVDSAMRVMRSHGDAEGLIAVKGPDAVKCRRLVAFAETVYADPAS